MRRSVALITLTLGIAGANSAFALDATRVVYDLSDLQQTRSATAAVETRSASAPQNVPMQSLPLSTPSLENRPSDGLVLESDTELEYMGQRGHNSHHGQGVNAPRGGGQGGGAPAATPNPEPGTMLLLGTALASGARFVRRRRS